MWMTKREFWIIFCFVQALGLLLAGVGKFHSSHVALTIGLILLLPGMLLAIGMFAAFNILKSDSLFLLAPGILLAVGVNTACCFGVAYAIESQFKKLRARAKEPGLDAVDKR